MSFPVLVLCFFGVVLVGALVVSRRLHTSPRRNTLLFSSPIFVLLTLCWRNLTTCTLLVVLGHARDTLSHLVIFSFLAQVWMCGFCC